MYQEDILMLKNKMISSNKSETATIDIGTIFRFNSIQKIELNMEDNERPNKLQRTSLNNSHILCEIKPEIIDILYIVTEKSILNNNLCNKKQWIIERMDKAFYVSYILIEDDNGNFYYSVNHNSILQIPVNISIFDHNETTLEFYFSDYENYEEPICEIYNNIAKKYYMNQDYLKAIEFYNKSLNMHLYVYDVITLPMGRSISLEIEKCKMKQKDELYRFLEYLYQIRKLKPNKYGFLQPAFFKVMFKEYFFPNPKKSYK